MDRSDPITGFERNPEKVPRIHQQNSPVNHQGGMTTHTKGVEGNAADAHYHTSFPRSGFGGSDLPTTVEWEGMGWGKRMSPLMVLQRCHYPCSTQVNVWSRFGIRVINLVIRPSLAFSFIYLCMDVPNLHLSF